MTEFDVRGYVFQMRKEGRIGYPPPYCHSYSSFISSFFEPSQTCKRRRYTRYLFGKWFNG